MAARTLPTMPDWTTGQEITSSLLNQITTYARFFANPPMFRMYQSVAQSVPNGADTQLTMDVSDYDTDSGRAVTTPWAYTIPAGMTARWTFSAAVLYAGNATGTRVTSIRKNGVVLPDGGITAGAGASVAHGYLATVTVPVAAGDVISVWTWQNSGGALSTSVSTASGLSYFEGRLVSLANP